MIVQPETENGRLSTTKAHNPPLSLPYRIQGKTSNLWGGFFVLFFLPGVWTALLIGLGWEAETLSGEIAALIGIIAINGFGLHLAYNMIWKHTRYTIFSEDEVIVQWLIQQKRFKTADLTHMKIKTWQHTGKGGTKTFHGLELSFNSASIPYLLRQMDFAEPLVPLLPKLCKQYGLAFTHDRELANVPYRWFGNGSVTPFKRYFKGQSSVNVKNIDDVLTWLIRCRYERDRVLFNSSDYWQHPPEFEKLRKGDCEDHALWAWRKLVELGIDAEFVVGRTPPDSTGSVAHAWVIYTQNGEQYLLESVSKNRRTIIKPLHETNSSYFPHYSVNGRFQTFQYPYYVIQHRGKNALAKIT